MKKNNSGFTLVEVLAVLSILVIILLVAFPNFASLTSKAKSKYNVSTKLLLKNAATMYVNNNLDDINAKLSSNSIVCIPIGTLIAYEYLDSELRDLEGNRLNEKSCINLSKTTNSSGDEQYIYDVDNSDTIGDNIDYLPPIITIQKKEYMECKLIMEVSSKEEFEENCDVLVTDDKDTMVNLEINETSNNINSKLFLEYTATDSSGNKAIPLKIELKIK